LSNILRRRRGARGQRPFTNPLNRQNPISASTVWGMMVLCTVRTQRENIPPLGQRVWMFSDFDAVPKTKYTTLGPKFYVCIKMAITRRTKHLQSWFLEKSQKVIWTFGGLWWSQADLSDL
jgi:hypothetical protein